MNKKWWVIGGVAAVVVILVVSLGFMIMNAINSATVSVTVAPSVAKVMISGREDGAVGTYKMAPGEYEVEITAEGFKSKSGKLVAKANESVSVQLYLEPEDSDSDWYKTHPEDALVMGEVKNAETVKTLEALGEKYPILGELPYRVEYYTKDYSNKIQYTVTYELKDGDAGFVIVIKDYMGNGRELALSWLNERGVSEAGGYVIRYVDMSGEGLGASAK